VVLVVIFHSYAPNKEILRIHHRGIIAHYTQFLKQWFVYFLHYPGNPGFGLGLFALIIDE
jgi:hypothetical protein